MTDHDDSQLDTALEALARPDPPIDHVARVLARTSARTGSPVDTQDGQLAAYLRPRWVLPVAATILAVLGTTWQMNRQVETWLTTEMAGSDSRPYQPHVWGAPREIDRPVLPPQAYWGMDPFREFATLRQGARVTAQGRAFAGRVRDVGTRRPLAPRDPAADDELAWAPVPSGLPPIELVPIAPAPLVAAPVGPIEEIALADIPLAPIVIGPITEEENP